MPTHANIQTVILNTFQNNDVFTMDTILADLARAIPGCPVLDQEYLNGVISDVRLGLV